jgi:CRP-like cAMP-binding protein
MTTPTPLSHIPLFARLDAAGDEALRAVMTRQSVKANDPIFWFGDRGDTLYVVDEGRVEVTAPDTGGGHVRLDTLGPGGVFGELGLIDGGPRSATVRALTDCSLLALPREPFQAFLRQRPDVAIDMLQVLGTRLRNSTATIRGLPNPNGSSPRSPRWQKVSDVRPTVAASQAFTLTHIGWFGSWILLNTAAAAGLLPRAFGFDPYPFGLLTLIVSLEAIFLSIFVLVSQNRQSERDRIRTDLDYQVNVKAHVEIVGIAERLARIEQALSRPRGPAGVAGANDPVKASDR